VSCDSVYAHKAWTEKEEKDGGIKGTLYPILSDVTRTMVTEYRMLNDNGVCYRATVILDKEHVVRNVSLYDDKVGRSVDEVLRVVKNLKLMDENKDVAFCPCDYNGQSSK